MTSWEARGRKGWDPGLTHDWNTDRVLRSPGCGGLARSPRPDSRALPSSRKESSGGGPSCSTSVWELCSPERQSPRPTVWPLLNFFLHRITADSLCFNRGPHRDRPVSTHLKQNPSERGPTNIFPKTPRRRPSGPRICSFSETSSTCLYPWSRCCLGPCHFSTHCPLQPPDPAFLCSLVGFLLQLGHVFLPTWQEWLTLIIIDKSCYKTGPEVWTELRKFTKCLLVLRCPVLSHPGFVQLFCNPMDGRPPGSSVHGISQARILERVARPSSRASSQHRDQAHIPCISRQVLYHWAAWEAPS